MLFGKLVTAATAVALSVLTTSVEAKADDHKPRSRGFRSLINYRCKNSKDIVVGFGGTINRRMRHFGRKVTRKLSKLHFYVAANGRDLKKPHKLKETNKNQKFIRKMLATERSNIVLLPWTEWRPAYEKYEPKKKNRSRRKQKESDRKLRSTRHIVQRYVKSADAFEEVIGHRPLAVHVPTALLKRGVVKALTEKGFVVIGNTVKSSDNKVLNKKSFIGLMGPQSFSRFRKFKRHTKGGKFEPVPLHKCLDREIYVSNNREEEAPQQND